MYFIHFYTFSWGGVWIRRIVNKHTCCSCCLSFWISVRWSSLKRSGVMELLSFLWPAPLKSPFSRPSAFPAEPCNRSPLHFPPSSLPGELAAVGVALPLGGAELRATRWAQAEEKGASHRVRCWASALRRLFFCSRSLFRAFSASSSWLSEISFRRNASSNWLFRKTVSSSKTLISCFRPSYSTFVGDE